MKTIAFIAGVFFTLSAGAQNTINFKDTAITFTANKYVATVFQADNSVDSYTSEIQNNKLVILFDNDESAGSLKGYVFLITTLNKAAFKETCYMRRGVGLVVKGKAKWFSKSDSAQGYTDTELTVAFTNDADKNAFIEKLQKVK
jgi:hypothetical protein